MPEAFPGHQSFAECHGIIEVVEFTDSYAVKLPPIILIGNNMGINIGHG